jgi:hypothetical protein
MRVFRHGLRKSSFALGYVGFLCEIETTDRVATLGISFLHLVMSSRGSSSHFMNLVSTSGATIVFYGVPSLSTQVGILSRRLGDWRREVLRRSANVQWYSVVRLTSVYSDCYACTIGIRLGYTELLRVRLGYERLAGYVVMHS